MAALLAGARLVLRQGVRLLPVYTQRPRTVPLRCLSSSSRFFTVVAQEKGIAESASAPVVKVRPLDNGSIHLIGSRLKKIGRVGKQKLLGSFKQACKEGQLNSNQAWFFLRACGSFMPEVPLVERTEVANNIWNELKELGVELNVTHYNTLLEVYIQNEHVFSPTEFLANMEAANVEPDQGTCQGLIAAYCSKGDIEGASQILGFMKSKNFPITEEVFNSLIKGHARAGDMESAKNVLSIMQSSGIEPRWSTHVALLTAYAEKGDIENIRQILNDSEINVPQRQLTSVILSLAKSGYSQYVPDVLEHMPNCLTFLQDIVNLSLALLTQGYEDAALEVAKRLSAWKPAKPEIQPGDFFLRHCVNLNMPFDVLLKFGDQLAAAGMQKNPKEFLLQCALARPNIDLSIELMKSLKDEGTYLRHRHFRPALTKLRNSNDLQGLIKLLINMKTVRLDVEIDVLSKCLSCIFSEANAGQAILQDKEFLEDLEKVRVSAVKCALFQGDLRSLYSFLSSSDTPIPMDRGLVGALSAAFVRSNDVELLAKITGLLYKDGSDGQDSSRPTESVGYFLYYMIGRMDDSMEEQLRQYFHQLKEMGFTVNLYQYRGIQKLLQQHGMPQLNEDLKRLLKSSAALTEKQVENIETLEEQLANLEKENRPIQDVLLKLLGFLRVAKDLPKALQLKSKYEEVFTFGMYMKLLALCCEENNAAEALKVKRELDQKGFTTVASANKYIALLKVLTENGLIQDAINILKEMQEKDVPVKETTTDFFFHIFNNLALKGDAQSLNLLHEYSVMMGLINPNSRMCSPLVMVHFKKNDLPASLNAMTECIKKYKCAPLIHDLLSVLAEKGETDLIKKAVDSLGDFMGEQSMLHELLFAFIRAGKYNEAEKIAETPGLRAQPNKISAFSDRCLRTNKVDLMEKFVELSRKLYNCDREDLYFQLFKLYDQNDEWEKAMNAWHKMTEENILPQESTLRLLKKILKRNRQDVSALIPESTEITVRGSGRRVADLLREGNVTEAFALFQESAKNDVPLSQKTYWSLMKTLVKDGLLKEAAEVEDVAKNRVKDYSLSGTTGNLLLDGQVRQDCLEDALVTLQTMLDNGSVPGRRPLNRLVIALAQSGDLPGLEKIKELSQHHQSVAQALPVGLNAYVALAHLKNGDLEEGISMMESLCINQPNKTYTLFLSDQLLKFNMEEAVEKLSILAERMANQFANYRPVTDLFLSYVGVGRVEEARHLLQRCNAIAEQREQLSRQIRKQMRLKEEDKVARLVELLSDPHYKQIMYSYKMKNYESSKEVDAAVALYEQAKAEHTDPDELFLKRLAVLLRGAGKPVPFSEPPESLEYYKERLKKQTSQDNEDQQKEE